MDIVRFTRDLRTVDNNCIENTIEKYGSKNLVGIFIFTKKQIDDNDYFSNNSFQFMVECIQELPITSLYGEEEKVLVDLFNNNRIRSFNMVKDYTPFALDREDMILNLCNRFDIEFNVYPDVLMFEPETVIKKYRKFTPYYNVFIKQKIIKPKKKKRLLTKKRIKSKYVVNVNDMITDYNEDIEIHGGRKNALDMVRNYDKKLYDDPKLQIYQNTSRLSAYIKFGCISIREAFAIDTLHSRLTRQLIWREFYYQEFDGFDTKKKYKWKTNNKLFNKFISADTGIDIVDAIINKLLITGFITNRSRLIVADYLIHHLGLSWKLGEKFFANHLIDYDPIVNNGNWRWVLNSRKFNTELQRKKFDKDSIFIASFS